MNDLPLRLLAYLFRGSNRVDSEEGPQAVAEWSRQASRHTRLTLTSKLDLRTARTRRQPSWIASPQKSYVSVRYPSQVNCFLACLRPTPLSVVCPEVLRCSARPSGCGRQGGLVVDQAEERVVHGAAARRGRPGRGKGTGA